MTPKTKGNKERKNYCRHFETMKKIYIICFPRGRYNWDRCHQVHVLMCIIDTITMDSYAPGLCHLPKCHRRVIPASPCKQNQILWESIHISGFPFLEVYPYFKILPFRTLTSQMLEGIWVSLLFFWFIDNCTVSSFMIWCGGVLNWIRTL